MADCYFHGYSGSAGACPLCEAEARMDQEPGTLPPGPLITQEDVDNIWKRDFNSNKKKKKKR
jgi:hypothetical protein